jgi:hypothetical protein
MMQNLQKHTASQKSSEKHKQLQKTSNQSMTLPASGHASFHRVFAPRVPVRRLARRTDNVQNTHKKKKK